MTEEIRSAASAGDVTRLLRAWRSGDDRALDALAPLVYAELRRRAARSMRSERREHSLQGTELVHEVFLRLVQADVSWQDRAHFVAVASRAMRNILVDHARTMHRAKRGGGMAAVPLDEAVGLPQAVETDPEDLLALDRALEELQTHDPQSAEAVVLSVFGGMTVREIAEVQQIPKSNVQRRIGFAKPWLERRVGGDRGFEA